MMNEHICDDRYIMDNSKLLVDRHCLFFNMTLTTTTTIPSHVFVFAGAELKTTINVNNELLMNTLILIDRLNTRIYPWDILLLCQ